MARPEQERTVITGQRFVEFPELPKNCAQIRVSARVIGILGKRTLNQLRRRLVPALLVLQDSHHVQGVEMRRRPVENFATQRFSLRQLSTLLKAQWRRGVLPSSAQPPDPICRCS